MTINEAAKFLFCMFVFFLALFFVFDFVYAGRPVPVQQTKVHGDPCLGVQLYEKWCRK